MKLRAYLINEISFPSWVLRSFNMIKKVLSKMTFSQFNKECEKSFRELVAVIDPDDLSRFLKKLGIDERILKESVVNEDAKHWWELIKTEAFPALSFYPALQVWLELDKMIKGTEYSGKVIGFYAAFWLLLISGKYIKGWIEWKKQNPDQYKLEKSWGGGGLI